MLYLPWRFQKSRVLNCKLNNNYTLSSIREWVVDQNPSVTTSTHWWFKDLPPNIKEMFNNTSKDKKIIEMFRKLFGNNYMIDVLKDMNEVYVSPPSNNNKDFVKNASDNIFYTRHIDGPFFYIPFASCYRVIVGLDDNRDIMTIFNITPETYIIKTGDVIGFDFHRESHYISPIIWNACDDTNDSTAVTAVTVASPTNYRVILKIHYCVYPNWAIVFGFILSKLSILYNKLFRDLFIFTLKPKSKYTSYLAKFMVISTQVYHDIEFYIGYNNIQYVAILLYISSKTHSNVFLFGSSFVHYLRWIDTSKYTSEITNLFRRDYYFFKFLYMLQYFYMYFTHSYNTEYPAIYTTIIVPPLLALCVYNYTSLIPKIVEIYLTCELLNKNRLYVNLKYTEYIYIFINILLNYIQLSKPIAMRIW
jgi:hypothetical protein